MTTRDVAVSVVICAYADERWAQLGAAIRGIAAQRVPAGEVLLVIDHNPRLAARAAAEFPAVTVLANSRRRGLSGARNTGIAAANGEIIAFLDDDATPDPDWLAELLAPYRDAAVQAVGGAAHPLWPNKTSRPHWLPAAVGAEHGELDWIIGCTYTGQPAERADVRNLMGCSMSFRRAVFADIGGFAEDIGRVGTVPLGCEETELCIRLRQHRPSARIVFEPRAVVGHHVASPRTRFRYLCKRSWAEGVSKAAISRLVGSGDALSTERRYLREVLPRAVRRQLVAATAGRPGAAAGAAAIGLALACTSAGYLRGLLDPRRSRAARAELATTPLPPPAAMGPASSRQAAGRARQPMVSIVVPTVDRPDALIRCVKSLLGNDYPRFEIIVVDNRPDPAEPSRWNGFFGIDARVRCLAEPRRGVSYARNTGIAAAGGEYVAFVDDDIDVDRRWLATLVAELDDPAVDCATSLVLPSSVDTPAQQAFEELKGFGQGSRRRVFGPELAARRPGYAFTPGDFGPGGCALWRRSTLRRLGGFDPLLGPGTPSKAGEDLHLFLRLARAGGRVVYAPDAVAFHEHAADWPQLRSRIRGYGTGLSAMLLLHVARRPADLLALARVVPGRVRQVLHPAPDPTPQAPRPAPASAVRPGGLAADQLLGLLSGPFALAASVVVARRTARRTVRHEHRPITEWRWQG